MKRKRLDRDAWGFGSCPFFRTRIDEEFYHGIVCLIRLRDVPDQYWETPKAGRVRVAGDGMTWLELIPDGEKRLITAMYLPDGTRDPARTSYPEPADPRYPPSVWYVDVIDGTETDGSGNLMYRDLYLDVIFTPEGDLKVDDREELDAAYSSGELSRVRYEGAAEEGERIVAELARDPARTDRLCAQIRAIAEAKLYRSGAAAPEE